MDFGLYGSSGRLGKEVAACFSEKNHKLVYGYDLDGTNEIGNAEIIIDCSLPEVFDKSLNHAIELSVPFIIAVTGLSPDQLIKLKTASDKIPVVQSFNFSVGVQVLLKLASMANDILDGWDVEISETHHRFKKDKPSGTAKMIAESLKGRTPNISSLRLGNISGDHTVYFGGLGETLSITHSAISRRTFAEGILLSAEFVMKKQRGLFTFTDVVFGETK
ncbi:MAG: 4-hydroxy-tetrahydrodipicolinate reductase [Ignavibacteriales bacterium]|nr:MAG: 4-hydroxy-tetrahydrodipicolinate reductase [Ignavibacteriales bacterium]